MPENPPVWRGSGKGFGMAEDHGAGEGRRTPLYDRHIALGARMIQFAGWIMPVQYSGIINEHLAVRTRAGLFDLGHMGQVDVAGPDAEVFLQYVTTNDVSALKPGQAQYSLLPNEQGGVVDDIIVYRRPFGVGYMVVVNAANRDKDVAWLNRHRAVRSDLAVELKDISDETGMIAIQGPLAEQITQKLAGGDLSAIADFSWRKDTIAGVEAMIARTGYTGEDGFEIYTAIGDIIRVWDALYEVGTPDGLLPVGLGARDTLRLEARMPLYGQELADDISPLEAGLGWAVKLEKGDFIGRDKIAAMKAAGPPRKLVGFKLIERGGIPRTHYPVQVDGREVGHVTSGAYSPVLQANIGLALIERAFAGVGKPLDVVIRGKPVKGVQVKTPFYKREG